ncbi:MAG: VWA domain-containing protein [Acidimicrobiales bacterium]
MSEAAGSTGFPFAAVVGMEDVKLALLIGAVEPRLGGVLLRGEKGSAKTTLARGLAAIMPGEPAPPFVDLPIGATEDRLVGTLDLSAVLHGGERRFAPGLLSAADGGLLYVDEVNLLPDHLVDVLLDVAASGVNRVERDGVSVQHPARFFLVGSMNPEEGELRPQLLDRFGLAVEVASSTDPLERAEAVRRRLQFDADPAAFVASWAEETKALAAQLASCVLACVPAPITEVAARMAVALGADGLRADLALCRAAAAFAGLEGRSEALVYDLRTVAPLALGHRRRRGPFDSPGVSPEELDEALESALRQASGGNAGAGPPGEAPAEVGRQDGPTPLHEAGEGPSGRRHETGWPAEPRRQDEPDGSSLSRPDVPQPASERPAAEGPGADGPAAEVLAIGLPQQAGRQKSSSASYTDIGARRGRHPTADRLPSGSGRPISSRPAEADARRVALVPTVLASAARRDSHPAGGPSAADGDGALVDVSDLQEVVAERRLSHLIVLCVDASGSMGAEQRATAARGAVLRLLTDAYQRRDRVAVVSFSGSGAQLILRPTGSIEVARSRLAAVPTGGRTPLAEAILCALDVCLGPSTRGFSPVLVLISDGRATAAPDGLDPVAAAMSAAERVGRAGVPALVVDVESGASPLRLGEAIAEQMGGRYLRLGTISGEGIDHAVRSVLIELQPRT